MRGQNQQQFQQPPGPVTSSAQQFRGQGYPPSSQFGPPDQGVAEERRSRDPRERNGGNRRGGRELRDERSGGRRERSPPRRRDAPPSKRSRTERSDRDMPKSSSRSRIKE